MGALVGGRVRSGSNWWGVRVGLAQGQGGAPGTLQSCMQFLQHLALCCVQGGKLGEEQATNDIGLHRKECSCM